MKKLFFGLTIFLLVIFGSIYALLFTAQGNKITANFIQDYVNSKDERVNLNINEFSLSTKFIVLDATIDENSFIKIEGDLKLFEKAYDLVYDINIKDLSKLEKFTSTKLNGDFKTNGKIVGDVKLLTIDGKSDVASSNTTYHIELTDFNPSKIVANIKNAKIEELLSIVGQPIYSKGLLNIDADILSANTNALDGKVITTILNGDLNEPLINKSFDQNITIPITYNTKITTNLKDTFANSVIDFNSNILNLDTKKTSYDINKGDLTTDYKLSVPDLSKLQDFTKNKLRGNVVVDGDVKYIDKKLYADGLSNIFGGKLDFKLNGDDFNSNIKGVSIKELTHMLYYPEVFESSSDLNIAYNLKSKAGDIKGKLINGHFLANEFSNTINNLAKFDITKEVYESVNINSNINDKLIKSTLDMNSTLTQIKVTSSTINLDKRTLEAMINSTIKNISFDTIIGGTLDNPTVKIDTSTLIKNAANKEINKQLDKQSDKLQKKLEEKIGGEGAKQITDTLKSLFN